MVDEAVGDGDPSGRCGDPPVVAQVFDQMQLMVGRPTVPTTG